MAVSQTGAACAAALGGGIGRGTPAEDDPEIVAAIEATFSVDPNGTRYFYVNPTTHVVTAGTVDIPGKDDHTTKWSPGAGGNGTWDGLQRR